MIKNWLRESWDNFNSTNFLRVVLPGLIIVILTGLAFIGQIRLLTMLAMLSLAGIVFLRFPRIALLFWMLVGTNFFEFVAPEQMPYIQLAQGLRLTLADLMLLLLLGISFWRLSQKKVTLLFQTPMLIWAGMIVILFGIHLLVGDANLDTGLNVLRSMMGYGYYIIFTSLAENRREFDGLVKMWLVIMVVSVVLQVVEASIGHRLSLSKFGFGVSTYFGKDVLINVGNQRVLYIWNRAWYYSQIGLYLSLGAFLGLKGQARNKYFFLVGFGILGVLIALIRQVYIQTVIGVLVVLALQRQKLKAFLAVVMIALLILIMANLATPLTSATYHGNPVSAWIGRIELLGNVTTDSSYQVRLTQNQKTIGEFWNSPFWGYGPGPVYQRLQGVDIGIVNSFLLYGLIGMAVILSLWGITFGRGVRLIGVLPAGIDRGYVVGVLAFLIGSFIISLFGTDYVMGGIIVALSMTVIDRIHYFSIFDSSKPEMQS